MQFVTVNNGVAVTTTLAIAEGTGVELVEYREAA